MTTLEIILFIAIFIWLGAVIMRADNLISDIQKRLDEIEKHLKRK